MAHNVQRIPTAGLYGGGYVPITNYAANTAALAALQKNAAVAAAAYGGYAGYAMPQAFPATAFQLPIHDIYQTYWFWGLGPHDIMRRLSCLWLSDHISDTSVPSYRNISWTREPLFYWNEVGSKRSERRQWKNDNLTSHICLTYRPQHILDSAATWQRPGFLLNIKTHIKDSLLPEETHQCVLTVVPNNMAEFTKTTQIHNSLSLTDPCHLVATATGEKLKVHSSIYEEKIHI